jgi:hypothetical protein
VRWRKRKRNHKSSTRFKKYFFYQPRFENTSRILPLHQSARDINMTTNITDHRCHHNRHIIYLWLYSPILGLGSLHETFRFISITRSRTVIRTPWTGDQLVARPLLPVPGDCDDGKIGGMNDFWQGKPKYSEKTCPDANLSTTNPTCQTRARTRAAAVGSQRLTAWAMARPA